MNRASCLEARWLHEPEAKFRRYRAPDSLIDLFRKH